jgi:glucuronate isomerase
MKAFNDTDFLLHNEYGKKLYHQVAAILPIIDPHNHIDPSALAANKQFENIYQLWVQHDPYKHRAMRIYGIAEDLITGNRSEYEKFMAWATCFPATVGNPLFQWCCMELKELFGITAMLNPLTAKQIWEEANNKLSQGALGALDIIKKLGVEMLCTSDDLTDSLEHHITLGKQQKEVTCLPSLRSDSIVAFNQSSFFTWVEKLQNVSGISISNLETYKTAIINRLNFFDEAGCLLSDHSFDSGYSYTSCNNADAESLFELVLKKETLNEKQFIILQSHLLHFLGKEYAIRNWKMQLHIGAYRYTSTVLRNKLGPAGGYACIGNTADVQSLTLFLDELDKDNALPKTILYTLNPADNAVFASITGSYSQDNVQGKIQYGPAWWYNDHYEGITQQLLALSSYGLLATSFGMTTDSRSLVSFIRHDYYRRILCNLIGSWVEEGKLPDDWDLVSTMVKNISYYNIKNWIAK